MGRKPGKVLFLAADGSRPMTIRYDKCTISSFEKLPA